MEVVQKLWGAERILHNDSDYCMKELTLNLGFTSSMHMHKVKRETFLVTAGQVCLEVLNANGIGITHTLMNPKDFVTLEPGTYHSFAAITPVATVIEASTKHDDNDVYRKTESCRNHATVETYNAEIARRKEIDARAK